MSLFVFSSCESNGYHFYENFPQGYVVSSVDVDPAVAELPTQNIETSNNHHDYNKYYEEDHITYDYKPKEEQEALLGPFLALTFDDGPHHSVTPFLLDALYERGVPATFFLIGHYAYRHPNIVERIHNEGHLIGNHSFSHGNFTRISLDDVYVEIAATNAILYNITGQTPTLLRPPYGAHNEDVLQIAKYFDLAISLWSVDPRDWYHEDAYAVFEHIISHYRENSVILLHDIYESSAVAAIMAVDYFLEKGYIFVTVDELYNRLGFVMNAGAVHRSPYRDGSNLVLLED